MKKNKPCVGITLTFVVRSGRELSIQDASFMVRENTLRGIMAAAKKIGQARSWGDISQHKDFVKYLGLDDVFGIVGPFGHGAMMGQTSKFSYKNSKMTQRLLARHKEFTINMKGCDPAIDNLYIVRFVYFLGKPVPYKSRRALVCWGIVKSFNKRKIVAKAIKLAQSPEFMHKITLKDYDERFSSGLLHFVGIANIIPVFEKLRVGSCFLYNSRTIKSINYIKKIIFPVPQSFKDGLESILCD